MEFTFNTPTEAWMAMTQLCLDSGKRATPRGLANLEINDRVHIRIIRPSLFPMGGAPRQFRHAITAVEGLSLIGQTSMPELILDRVKAFRPFLNSSIFHGAYGPRAAGHLAEVVDLLRRDPDSRQAVISLYDASRDLNRPKIVDVPCTMNIQFLRRNDRLHMWVTMRSNDVWRGMPYDFGQFALLQSAIAQALGIEMGTYTHSVGSLHLYDTDHDKADEIAGAPLSPDLVTVPLFWGSDDIGEIASRCRRLLCDSVIPDPTPLEMWFVRALAL